MRTSGFQQQPPQMARIPHFVPQMTDSGFGSPQVTRRSMVSSNSSQSLVQQPRIGNFNPLNSIQQQQQPRYHSPMPNMQIGTSHSLSNSQISLQNNAPQGINSNNLVQDPLRTPHSPVHSTASTSAMNFNKSNLSQSMNGGFTNQVGQNSADETKKQALFISGLESQVKQLRDELFMSKALCGNTQKHNEQLIQKIKVLIKQNEKMQEIDQNTNKLLVNDKTVPVKEELSTLQSENTRFQTITRDLESKIQLLILENEKLVFMLKQSQIVKQSFQKQIESDSEISNGTLDGKVEPNVQKILEENGKLQQLLKEKTSIQEKLSSENQSFLIKIKELNVENEKLKVISEEASAIPEQQVEEIETKFTAILEENQRVNDLLSEKNNEVESLHIKIRQIEQDKKQYDSNNQSENQVQKSASIHSLTESNKNLNQKISILNEQNSYLQKQLDSNRNIIIEFQKQSQENSKMISSSETPSSLHLRFFEYEKAIKLENNQLRNQQESQAEAHNKILLQLSQSNKQLEDQSQVMKKLNIDLSNLEQEMQELKFKLSKSSEDIIRRKMENQKLFSDIFEKNEEIQQNLKLIKTLENKIVSLEKEKSILSNELTCLFSFVSENKEAVEKSGFEIFNVRQELLSQIAQNQSLVDENSKLSSKVHDLEEKFELITSQKTMNVSDQIGYSLNQKQDDIIRSQSKEQLNKLLSLEKELMEIINLQKQS